MTDWNVVTAWIDKHAGIAIVAACVAFALSCAATVVMLMRRRRRALSRAWAQEYFHGGGLIWQLVQRWSRTPRLTDQRARDKAAPPR
ncbi:hypothetical protein [Sphingomonas sp.]|jgi:hypothetical protein|uniref:hypothetical protein n=1 Tax=Sphingomonas sp. TaxID=28214 RepID=UPI0035C7DF50